MIEAMLNRLGFHRQREPSPYSVRLDGHTIAETVGRELAHEIAPKRKRRSPGKLLNAVREIVREYGPISNQDISRLLGYQGGVGSGGVSKMLRNHPRLFEQVKDRKWIIARRYAPEPPLPNEDFCNKTGACPLLANERKDVAALRAALKESNGLISIERWNEREDEHQAEIKRMRQAQAEEKQGLRRVWEAQWEKSQSKGDSGLRTALVEAQKEIDKLKNQLKKYYLALPGER